MKQRAAMREEEAKAARDAQRQRFAEERRFREQKREELRQRELQAQQVKIKPLYKRREEAAAKKAAEEEEKRQQFLHANRQQYRPVDFLQSEVMLPDKAYSELPAGQQHYRAHRDKADSNIPALPPINKNYYRGTARDRVVAELKEQRAKGTTNRKQAAEKKTRALKYSKLVSELIDVHVQDSTRSRPPLDPARANSARPAAKAGAGGQQPRGRGGGGGGGGPSTSGAPSSAVAGGRGSGAPGRRLEGAAGRGLEERSAALNKELRRKESVLQGQLASAQKGAEGGADLEAVLQVRSDLSAVYIGAIRSKVELLEEINGVKEELASPANTA